MDIFPVVPGMTLELGKTGTHYVRAFRFDISAWQEAYPDGIINLIHRLPDANEPYVAGYLRLGEGYIDWVVQSSDVAVPGYGECELVMIVDGVAVDKTDTYPTHIEEQLGTNSVTPPTGATWVEQVLTVGNATLQAVDGFEDLVAEKEQDITDLASGKEQNITDLAAQKIAAIEAKGAQTLDSIPEDYTELSGEVDDLKGASNNTTDNIEVIGKHLIKAISGDGLSVEKFPVFSNGIKRNQAVDVPPASDTRTICTQAFKNELDSSITVNVKCDTGYVAVVARFDTTGAYAGFRPSAYRNDISVEVEAGYYYCIEVRKDPVTDFNISEFSPDKISISLGTADNIPMQTAIQALQKANAANDNAILANIIGNKKADKLSIHDIWGIRRSYKRAFTNVPLPNYSFLSDIDVLLFSDGYNYKAVADFEGMKNNSAHTVRVSNSADLASAISSATSGDTIVLAKGVYSAVSISKSLNIIGENAVIMPVACGSFSASAMENVYSCAMPDSISAVYDISDIENGIIRKLTSVSNVSNLSTAGRYYKNSTTLYVHLFNDRVPTPNIVFCDQNNANAITIGSMAENGKVYIEGITAIGGMNNLDYRANTTYTDQTLIAKNCRFLYANAGNAVTLKGVKGFFEQCEAAFAYYDGFNYHGINDETTYLSHGLEIDCIAHDNGIENTNLSCNGSTMHNGGKAVRINGVYYHNHGGNVADITAGTETSNYGCIAFDSTAEDSNEHTNADFWAYYSAMMYVYGCRGIGDSMANLFAGGNATLYYQKTEFDTKRGNVEEIA